MKFFTALHLMLTITLPAKVDAIRSDSERGSEVIAFAVIAAAVLAIAIAVVAALSGTTNSYIAQIHG
ncbi:hypothetical protein [Propionicimonas sp.]|uniref:hypothetical protein n=1 Tax=Propionicimonas sp. TaxID=1955623 RepID=UPI00185A1F17|nr:hypothetical protein [Propionicimonas sp.]MBA3019661.1 hypothetical protein [Propionicimonas sp.]MBU4207994.1 hypothetical protein [Actinomycetota bacterium]MBU4411468.1 hypothetical protein [Actinomycetota bacterium]MCG2805780.1 hypothetical protein [Propionicimonas sp.]